MRGKAEMAKRWVFCLAVIGLVLMSGRDLQSQERPALTLGYFEMFLDRAPTNSDQAMLPQDARDVLIAKVRVVGGPSWLGGRDQSGMRPPLPLEMDLFGASIEVLDVLSGNVRAGTRLDVYFGRPGGQRRYKLPLTSDQKRRDYFVVSYARDDGKRRLLAVPISREEYELWAGERSRTRE
jgi:hypothetical protein